MNPDVTAVPAPFAEPVPAVAPPPLSAGASVAERLAEKRRAAERRAAVAQAERDAAELERLDLEERFERELSGKRGQAFEIVDASDLGEGHMVVKLGEDVLFTGFTKSKMGPVDTDVFVTPCLVYPSVDEYRKIVKRRAFLAARCAEALCTLYGVKKADDAGK